MRFYRKWKYSPQKILNMGLEIGWHRIKQRNALDCLIPHNSEHSEDKILEQLYYGLILSSDVADYIMVH
jgi:hypothetical protein